MGQQGQALSESVHAEKEPFAVRWRLPILAIVLTVLALLALTVLTVTPTGKSATLLKDADSRFVTNPELMIAHRYAASAARNSVSGFVAANPEVMLAGRHPGPRIAPAGQELLPANPELMVAHRYAAPVAR